MVVLYLRHKDDLTNRLNITLYNLQSTLTVIRNDWVPLLKLIGNIDITLYALQPGRERHLELRMQSCDMPGGVAGIT